MIENFIHILSDTEFLHSDLWCRPLYFEGGNFGGMDYYQMNEYGSVINNFKWVRITEVLGDFWLDGTHLAEELISKYEFLEGDPPASHCTSKEEIYKNEHN